MALSKAEVCRAFREVMAADYADVPAREEIDHIFSPEFYAKMAALIAEQKRGSWRLLSRKSRRVLVVAAILAVSMLLVACTPAWREAVSEFIVSIYERFVDYGTSTEVHEKIETIYVLDPLPEGVEFVSQDQQSPYFVRTIYQNEQGIELVLQQATGENLWGSMDKEQGEVVILTEEEISVLLYTSEASTTAFWTCDGYYMKLRYFSELSHSEVEALIAVVSPIE